MPNTFTNNLSLLKPDPNDVIDVTIINANMDTIDNHGTVPIFASTANRDAAYANAPFKLCMLGTDYDNSVLQVRKSGNWVPVSQDLAWTPVMTNSVLPAPSGIATGVATNVGGFVNGSLVWQRTATAGGLGHYVINLPVPPDPAWLHTGFPMGTFTVAHTGSYEYGFMEGFSATQGRFRVITAITPPTAMSYIGPNYIQMAANEILQLNFNYKAA
jgi:hypothetical protein